MSGKEPRKFYKAGDIRSENGELIEGPPRPATPSDLWRWLDATYLDVAVSEWKREHKTLVASYVPYRSHTPEWYERRSTYLYGQINDLVAAIEIDDPNKSQVHVAPELDPHGGFHAMRTNTQALLGRVLSTVPLMFEEARKAWLDHQAQEGGRINTIFHRDLIAESLFELRAATAALELEFKAHARFMDENGGPPPSIDEIRTAWVDR